jgi:hypothetical protein
MTHMKVRACPPFFLDEGCPVPLSEVQIVGTHLRGQAFPHEQRLVPPR